jgi:hypothetical protein
MMQSRRQVPSIAMIETSTPFSKTTLTPLRRSEVATLCTQDELFSQVTNRRPKACLSRPMPAHMKTRNSTVSLHRTDKPKAVSRVERPFRKTFSF